MTNPFYPEQYRENPRWRWRQHPQSSQTFGWSNAPKTERLETAKAWLRYHTSPEFIFAHLVICTQPTKGFGFYRDEDCRSYYQTFDNRQGMSAVYAWAQELVESPMEHFASLLGRT